MYTRNREESLPDKRMDWKVLLEEIRLENDLLKTRLASILDKKISVSNLERAEYFQNEFLKKDEIITVLKYELYQKEKRLAEKMEANGFSFQHKQLAREGKFYKNLVFLKGEFTRLKEDFNQYSSSIK